MKIDVEDVVYTMGVQDEVSVGTDDDGVVIELASSAFYKAGSADIRDEALLVLEKIAQSLMAPRYRNFMLEIEGHTDDDPIHTATFPSNWELSAGRATRVVRYLIEQGMDSERLKAAGFGASRPKVANRTADGAPIRENQAEKSPGRHSALSHVDGGAPRDAAQIDDPGAHRRGAGRRRVPRLGRAGRFGSRALRRRRAITPLRRPFLHGR